MERLLEYVWIAAAVVLLFGLSIMVHEFGHFWVARRRGLKVEAFAIGLGPKIVSWTRDGIEYSIRWIPAGGFVRLPQMVTSEALEGETEAKKPLPSAPPGSKILVAFAGPLMNVVFAFAVAVVIYFVGLPVLINPPIVGKVEPGSFEEKAGIRAGDRIVAISGKPVKSWQDINMIVFLAPSNIFDVTIERDGTRTNYQLRAKSNKEFGLKWLNLEPQEHPVVGYVEPGMPAAKAGLQKGDRFLSFNGVPVSSREHLIKLVAKSEGKQSTVTVEREGKKLTFELTPVYDPKTKRGRIGIVFAGGVYRLMRPGPKPWEQIANVWNRTVSTLRALLHSRETGVKARDLSGPVGILSALAIQTRTDIRLALHFLVLLNVNLALINLFPIPVLDGGHILLALLEKLRGRPANPRVIEIVTNVFALLLISFMLYITFFDVRRLPLFRALFRTSSPVEKALPAAAPKSTETGEVRIIPQPPPKQP